MFKEAENTNGKFKGIKMYKWIERLRKKEKGITLPIRTIVIIVLILVGLAFVAILASQTKGKGATAVEKILNELKEIM